MAKLHSAQRAKVEQFFSLILEGFVLIFKRKTGVILIYALEDEVEGGTNIHWISNIENQQASEIAKGASRNMQVSMN